MILTALCATDKNDSGVHDNTKIGACTSSDNLTNFKGEIKVDGLKVANLEDRDGLVVFGFTDGTGKKLIVTPNFIDPIIQNN